MKKLIVLNLVGSSVVAALSALLVRNASDAPPARSNGSTASRRCRTTPARFARR